METLIKNMEDQSTNLSETKRLDNVIFSTRRKMMALAGTAFAGIALSKLATPQASAQATVTDADILKLRAQPGVPGSAVLHAGYLRHDH